jgi:uncharacterized protein
MLSMAASGEAIFPTLTRREGPSFLARVCASLACALAVLALATSSVFAAEGDFQPIPKLEKRVTDLTASLSAADESRIAERLKAFEQVKGAQIAVLIVPTTQPEPIFDYAIRVGEAWKLGRKGVDDGALLIVAKNDRKMQILTGPGIQGVLTDAVSKRIIAETIAPRFREGNFADGIYNGVDKMIGVIEGEALPPPPQKRKATNRGIGYEGFFFLAIFAAIFVGPLLRALMGRFLGASATGGVTGLAAWWIAGGLIFPIVVGAVVFFVALLMGFANWSSARRGDGGGWISTGGGGWGSSGGGGSSDSFSGGGGGFDGGGASGDW